MGTYLPALLFLNESMMDTTYVSGIESTEDIEGMRTKNFRTYPEWSWDAPKRTFKKTNPSIITEDMRERAVIAAKKVWAISRVIYWINGLRCRIDTGVFFQPALYAEKEKQAQAFKDANFDERTAPAAPYVLQYANHAQIPLRQAAEEILFQAQLDHEYLAKTEKIRLALFKKIRLAKTAEEIESALSAFQKNGVV